MELINQLSEVSENCPGCGGSEWKSAKLILAEGITSTYTKNQKASVNFEDELGKFIFSSDYNGSVVGGGVDAISFSETANASKVKQWLRIKDNNLVFEEIPEPKLVSLMKEDFDLSRLNSKLKEHNNKKPEEVKLIEPVFGEPKPQFKRSDFKVDKPIKPEVEIDMFEGANGNSFTNILFSLIVSSLVVVTTGILLYKFSSFHDFLINLGSESDILLLSWLSFPVIFYLLQNVIGRFFSSIKKSTLSFECYFSRKLERLLWLIAISATGALIICFCIWVFDGINDRDFLKAWIICSFILALIFYLSNKSSLKRNDNFIKKLQHYQLKMKDYDNEKQKFEEEELKKHQIGIQKYETDKINFENKHINFLEEHKRLITQYKKNLENWKLVKFKLEEECLFLEKELKRKKQENDREYLITVRERKEKIDLQRQTRNTLRQNLLDRARVCTRCGTVYLT